MNNQAIREEISELFLNCDLRVTSFKFFATGQFGKDFIGCKSDKDFLRNIDKICNDINDQNRYFKAHLDNEFTIIVEIYLAEPFKVSSWPLDKIREFQMILANLLKGGFNLDICEPQDQDIICKPME